MKQASFLCLTICALLIASANRSHARDHNSPNRTGAIFATGPADGGRLFIKRSPILGYNVAITIWIDGKSAGPLMWGHTYDKYITPGRHILLASPNRLGGDWQTTLNVRPGRTYSYRAYYNVNNLLLVPLSGSPESRY